MHCKCPLMTQSGHHVMLHAARLQFGRLDDDQCDAISSEPARHCEIDTNYPKPT